MIEGEPRFPLRVGHHHSDLERFAEGRQSLPQEVGIFRKKRALLGFACRHTTHVADEMHFASQWAM